MMKAIAVGLGFGAAMFVIVLLTLVWAGVAVGAANAWILQGTFSAGWHAVWGRLLPALGWSILFLGSVFGGSRSAR